MTCLWFTDALRSFPNATFSCVPLVVSNTAFTTPYSMLPEGRTKWSAPSFTPPSYLFGDRMRFQFFS